MNPSQLTRLNFTTAVRKLIGKSCIRQGQTRSMTSVTNESTNKSPSSTSVQEAPPKTEPDVLFESVNQKGIITLNRPKALNSLNLSMARKIYPQLKAWESSQRLVIIKANGGKAFCAGGDVRAVTESAVAKGSLYKDFFRLEYALNALIGTLHIPYIALIDGITMGGGVGLSVHGRYRVATERTLVAMPETRIGLFPDVGTSYVLPRLGGKLGLYLALTGYRLKGSDVFKAGIATHVCDSSKLPALEQDLISLKTTNPTDIEQVLQLYHNQSPESRKPFTLEPQMEKINQLFAGSTIEEILNNLRQDGSKWSQGTLETLSQMSPTSLKISHKLLQLTAELDLQEALQMEYRLSQRCCEKHDFVEGVRALLIAKDNNPKWNPATLEAVTDDLVNSHFEPLPEKEELIL